MRIAVVMSSIAILAACGREPALAPEVIPEPAPTSAVAPEPPKSESLVRADALVAEMRAREEAQSKYDRENPPPPTPRMEDLIPSPSIALASNAIAPVPSASAGAPSIAAAAAPSASSADPKATEAWWKDQARVLQVKLEEDIALMNQARSAMLNSSLKITEDEAEREYRTRVAAVQNSRAALDRFRDDGRRAGVPAGWTRWP